MKPLIRMIRKIVEMSHVSGEGHIASALSVLDILWVLYDKVLDITPANIHKTERDHFILSKGHASLALYVVLAEKGFVKSGELKDFAKKKSILGGHPDRTKIAAVEASTGSLGHGFPMAVGQALALKIRALPHRVFVIIGDGECNEGAIWESVKLAAHHKLSNLICIVDNNHSTDRALKLGDLGKKFKSSGWHVLSVNGHDHEEIRKALCAKSNGRPVAIIAETVKGNGVKMMENNPEWHHKSPTVEEFNKIMNELKY